MFSPTQEMREHLAIMRVGRNYSLGQVTQRLFKPGQENNKLTTVPTLNLALITIKWQ
jgi:hypothetical protein